MKLLSKISIVFIIIYIFNVPDFLSTFSARNLGFDFAITIPFIFLFLPAVFIIGTALLNKSIRVPYFFITFATLFLFILLESKLFRGDVIIDLAYPYTLSIIYICFLSLVNYSFDSNDYYEIIKYSIIIYFGVIFLSILGYLNIIDMGAGFNLDRGSITLIGLHPNGHSFNATIIIFLLISCRVREKFNLHIGYKFVGLVLILLAVTLINGTRGAFIISLVGLSYHFFSYNQTISVIRKLFISILILIPLILTSIIDIKYITNNISSINRLTQKTNANSDRIQQIKFSWNNFKESVLFGKGYNNATRGTWNGNWFSRANFHYTQILASNGILYFIIYMSFLFSMFGFGIKNTDNFLVSLGVYSSLIFYNLVLIMPISLLAYIKYYNKNKIYI